MEPGVIQDFATLFSSWKKLGNLYRFQDFQNLWKDHQFKYLFAIDTDGHCSDEQWLTILYSCAYAYLLAKDDVRIQIGALYAVYLLWGTHPYKVKYPVVISSALYKEVRLLLSTQKNDWIVDGIAIFNAILSVNAWSITLSLEILPPPQYWHSGSSESSSNCKLNYENNRNQFANTVSNVLEFNEDYESVIQSINLGRHSADTFAEDLKRERKCLKVEPKKEENRSGMENQNVEDDMVVENNSNSG
jgi:hypothetical protein